MRLFTGLPLVQNYPTVTEWAKNLVGHLEKSRPLVPPQLSVYHTAAKAPNPTIDGLLAVIEGALCYSYGGEWIAVAEAP